MAQGDPRSNIPTLKVDYVASDFDGETKALAAAAFNETNSRINDIIELLISLQMIYRMPL